MKTAILALAFLFTAQASARSMMVHESAHLDQFSFQAGSPLSQVEVDSAIVNVDYLNQEVSVQIQPAMPECPAGMACIQMMPMPQVISAKLVKVSYNTCNQRIIEAETDQRPVDGILTKITVTDSMPMYCDIFLPATQVEIELEGSMVPFQEKHYLSGKALTP